VASDIAREKRRTERHQAGRDVAVPECDAARGTVFEYSLFRRLARHLRGRVGSGDTGRRGADAPDFPDHAPTRLDDDFKPARSGVDPGPALGLAADSAVARTLPDGHSIQDAIGCPGGRPRPGKGVAPSHTGRTVPTTLRRGGRARLGTRADRGRLPARAFAGAFGIGEPVRAGTRIGISATRLREIQAAQPERAARTREFRRTSLTEGDAPPRMDGSSAKDDPLLLVGIDSGWEGQGDGNPDHVSICLTTWDSVPLCLQSLFEIIGYVDIPR